MVKQERVAVVGLGYVGLPLAVAFARRIGVEASVIGFDVNEERVAALRKGSDHTREFSGDTLQLLQWTAQPRRIAFHTDPACLRDATVIIVTVPTPVTESKAPDLTLTERAADIAGCHLAPGTLVVLESTVYPGVTEDILVPRIERASGLRCGRDWCIGYSPERTNPGDRTHTITNVVKVVSGMDAATLDRIAALYERICDAGVYRAASIKVAEAEKVFENVQRDLGIAAVNELALICARLGISAFDVLAAARTKWNFVDYRPGLVGGHCIGVDPYYLAHRAEELGYHPEVILAGRRVNDAMALHVADLLLEELIATGRSVRGARVFVLGLTFKANVPDTRNSKVADAIARLRRFGIEIVAHDPLLDAGSVDHEFHVTNLPSLEDVGACDAVLVATLHDSFRDFSRDVFVKLLRTPGVVVDVSGHFVDMFRDDPNVRYRTF